MNTEIDLYTEAYVGKLEANHGEFWKFTDMSFAAVAGAVLPAPPRRRK